MSRMPSQSEFAVAATAAPLPGLPIASPPVRPDFWRRARVLAASAVREWKHRRDLRRLHSYAAFDGRMLSDIGVGTGEAEYATRCGHAH